MIIVTTWGFLKTYLCHEVHGKDERVMIQLEDWNSKLMSCRHCSNHTRSLKELFLRHHPEFSGLKFLFLKHEIYQDVSTLFHYNKIHLQNRVWKSLPVKVIVFPCKSWSESTGRGKMRLKKLLLDWWVHILGFLYILEDIRNKIHELGIHRTKLGRASIHQTQNSRKSMYITWVMNKSFFERYLD